METDYAKIKDLARDVTRKLTFQDREQLYLSLEREMRKTIDWDAMKWVREGARKEREDDPLFKIRNEARAATQALSTFREREQIYASLATEMRERIEQENESWYMGRKRKEREDD